MNIRSPTPFTGTFGESFSEWIEKLNHYMILQGINNNDDLYKVAYLEANLLSSALASFHELHNSLPRVNFESLVDRLKSVYPDDRDSDLHQQLLYDRKQK